MVSETGNVVQPQNIFHTEPHTKCFFDSEDYGNGVLYITQDVLLWRGENRNVELLYPSISLHAISRDTNVFPFECLYCLLESCSDIEESCDATEESYEKDPLPQVTEVRFVPSNKDNIQVIYDAVTKCQEMHPDPEDENCGEDIEEESEELSELFSLEGSGFYTSANTFDEVELSEDGHAVLVRLQQNMQISNEDEYEQMSEQPEENGCNGQYEDA